MKNITRLFRHGSSNGPPSPTKKRSAVGGTNELSRPDKNQPAADIAVMGAPGSGKTTFINLATGSNLRTGMGPGSCTAEIKFTNGFTLDGRKVTLTDIPGFDDTTKSDAEILNIIAAYLAHTSERGIRFSGIIYIHRISDNRFNGIAGRNFDMFRKLYGGSTLENVAIVTNVWNGGSQDINEACERELRDSFFKPALDGGAQMVRHRDTVESAHDIIRRVLKNNPTSLQIERELVIGREDIANTTAGKAVSQGLNEQIKRHQAELEKVREEIERALRMKDEGTRRELEEEARRLEERMTEIAKDEKGMSAGYVAEKARIEAVTKKGWEARKMVRDEANHAHNLRDETDVADRARSNQQMKRPQDLAPTYHDTLPNTRETGFPSFPQPHHYPPLPPSSTSSPQSTSHLASSSNRLYDPSFPSMLGRANASRRRSTSVPQDHVATAVTMPLRLNPRHPTSPPPLWEHTGVPEDKSISVPPVRIAVMGATGSGKTTFINLASGSNLRIGTGLESCTAEVQLASKFAFDGRPVVLIDTPGFDDTSKSDTDILKMIAFFLAETYEEGSTLAGVIYVHRISDNRFGGITGRNFNMFRKLCGESTLKNVVLVTNMWNVDPQDVSEARESQLSSKFFKPALDKGSQMVRHYNTLESAHNIIRKIVDNQPAVLQIQRELVEEGKDIGDTAAGETVDRELRELIKRHQAELEEVRGEMAQALKEKDEEMKRRLEEIKRDLLGKVEKAEKNLGAMAANYKAEKERAEVRMREMEEEAKQDRERAEAEYDQKLAALTSVSDAHQMRLRLSKRGGSRR